MFTMRGFILFMCAVLSAVAVEAQEPFNGRVLRIDGTGIKATVRVVGRDKTTRADGKGRFGLTDIKADDTLQLIFKKDTLAIPVDGRKSLDIVWAMDGDTYDATESEELINYGYGYVSRRESAEFTSGISGERLVATGCTNLLDAILICYPGLRYINGELCLRTQNSLGSSSAVLILCDGMETRLELINIHDVKSVEIIKSSNMYGFRGVNGVVLITTLSAEDVLKK